MSLVRVQPDALMKDISFKQASIAEFENFYPFFKNSISELFPYYPDHIVDFYFEGTYKKEPLKKDLETKGKRVYFALHKESIVGFLLVNKSYLGVAFAHWLAVVPQWQQKGVASKLLSLWEKDVLKEGGHALQLWTTNNNLHYYTNRGFILMGEFPNAWFGMNNFMLYKTLRKAEQKNYLREFLETKRATIKKS